MLTVSPINVNTNYRNVQFKSHALLVAKKPMKEISLAKSEKFKFGEIIDRVIKKFEIKSKSKKLKKLYIERCNLMKTLDIVLDDGKKGAGELKARLKKINSEINDIEMSIKG